MTLDEGLVVLGVDARASSEEVRRAYLKLVKVHKPERDPEGFRRVREAYELVSSQVRFRAAVEVRGAAPVEGTGIAPDAPDVADAPDTDAPSVLEQQELAKYFARLAEIPEKQRKRAAVTVWKEAVAAHPDSVVARANLHEAYRALRQRNDAGDVALRAYERGMVVFAHPILAFHARRAPPALMEQAAKDPGLRHLLPLAHVERHEFEQATELTLALLDDVVREEAALSPDVTFRVIAATGSGERPDLATRLVAGVQALLDEIPNAARSLSGGLAARWAVLREADRLRGELPAVVYQAMLKATIPENTEEGLQDALEWASEHRFQAWNLVRRLAKKSPVLHGTFARQLSPWKERSPFRVGWSWWWIFFVSMQLIRVCTSAFHSSSTPPTSSPHRDGYVAPAPARDELTLPELVTQQPPARSSAEAASAPHEDCDELAARVDRMELATRNLRDSDPRKAEMKALFARYNSQCLKPFVAPARKGFE